MQAQINRITDILRRDDGISGAMHYTEQISWILFLKFLDEYEKTEAATALLEGTTYTWMIKESYRWNAWAVQKKEDGTDDTNAKKTGSDLKEFVDEKLLPYLKSFRDMGTDYHSMH